MYTLRVLGTLFAALRKLPRPSTIAPPVHKIIIIVLRISVLSWVRGKRALFTAAFRTMI